MDGDDDHEGIRIKGGLGINSPSQLGGRGGLGYWRQLESGVW